MTKNHRRLRAAASVEQRELWLSRQSRGAPEDEAADVVAVGALELLPAALRLRHERVGADGAAVGRQALPQHGHDLRGLQELEEAVAAEDAAGALGDGQRQDRGLRDHAVALHAEVAEGAAHGQAEDAARRVDAREDLAVLLGPGPDEPAGGPDPLPLRGVVRLVGHRGLEGARGRVEDDGLAVAAGREVRGALRGAETHGRGRAP
mmetsp:Transcript_98606/g.317937  ORF Transcript_98606/g.317937 Transcript_98606/m.317937 type:complete len:206 (+) Transcript_98606:72-689(+)